MGRSVIVDLALKISADTAEMKKSLGESNKAVKEWEKETKNKIKAIESGFKTLNAVLIGSGGLVAAFELMKRGLESTGRGADTLAVATNSLKAGVDALARSIATADMDNLGANIINAMRAAKEFTQTSDLLDTAILDLSVRKSSLEGRIRELRVLQQEGKITKAQMDELKDLNQQLYQTEVDIYNARINAAVKFAADKMGVDASLFDNLQEGVIARSKLSLDEKKALGGVVDSYKAQLEALKNQFTTLTYNQVGDALIQIKDFDKEGYAAAVNQLIGSLSSVERVQVFEDLFSSPAEWETLIGYMNSLNQLFVELNSNATAINRAGKGLTKVAEGTPLPDDYRPYDVSYTPPSGAFTPYTPTEDSWNKFDDEGYKEGLAALRQMQEERAARMAEYASQMQTSWTDSLSVITDNVQSLTSAFTSLGNAMASASEDGKLTFQEAMNVMMQSALTLIPVIQALAAAQMISKEASKGIIGIATAVAGLTMLAGLFATWVTPKMAEGGLVYGETLATVGEYSGAGSNPEVIAPLSKLKSIIGDAGMGGEVRFRIDGDELVGILNKRTRTLSRF